MERARSVCVWAKVKVTMGILLLLALVLGAARAALADGVDGLMLASETYEAYVDEELELVATCTPGHSLPEGAVLYVVIEDGQGAERVLGQDGGAVSVTAVGAGGATLSVDGTALAECVGQTVFVSVRAAAVGGTTLASGPAQLSVLLHELYLSGDDEVTTTGTATLTLEDTYGRSAETVVGYEAYVVDEATGAAVPVAADALVVGEGGESVTLIGERLAAYVGRTVRVVARGTVGGVVVAESEPWEVAVVGAEPGVPGPPSVAGGAPTNDDGGQSTKGTGNPVGDMGPSLGGAPVVRGDVPAANDSSATVERGVDGSVVAGAPGVVDSPVAAPSIFYDVHCRNIGWGAPSGADGSVAGTTGESRRLEALVLRLSGVADGSVEYSAHLRTLGWDEGWAREGEVCGTTGQSRRLEAVNLPQYC